MVCDDSDAVRGFYTFIKVGYAFQFNLLMVDGRYVGIMIADLSPTLFKVKDYIQGGRFPQVIDIW